MGLDVAEHQAGDAGRTDLVPGGAAVGGAPHAGVAAVRALAGQPRGVAVDRVEPAEALAGVEHRLAPRRRRSRTGVGRRGEQEGRQAVAAAAAAVPRRSRMTAPSRAGRRVSRGRAPSVLQPLQPVARRQASVSSTWLKV